jgi:hypothetical protein
MPSSGTLHCVALVRTDVSEECIASIIIILLHPLFLHSVHRLLVMANIIPGSPILVTLMMGALRSSETSVLTRATCCNIPRDGILRSHRYENLKSYMVQLFSANKKGHTRSLYILAVKSSEWNFKTLSSGGLIEIQELIKMRIAMYTAKRKVSNDICSFQIYDGTT